MFVPGLPMSPHFRLLPELPWHYHLSQDAQIDVSSRCRHDLHHRNWLQSSLRADARPREPVSCGVEAIVMYSDPAFPHFNILLIFRVLSPTKSILTLLTQLQLSYSSKAPSRILHRDAWSIFVITSSTHEPTQIWRGNASTWTRAKNGKIRSSFPDRMLSNVTKPNRYQIPFPHDSKSNLCGKNIFYKIVLIRAYHNILVEPADISNSAF